MSIIHREEFPFFAELLKALPYVYNPEKLLPVLFGYLYNITQGCLDKALALRVSGPVYQINRCSHCIVLLEKGEECKRGEGREMPLLTFTA